jgi:hypothetical protein
MNVEIGTEASQFLFWENLNGIFIAVIPAPWWLSVNEAFFFVRVIEDDCKKKPDSFDKDNDDSSPFPLQIPDGQSGSWRILSRRRITVTSSWNEISAEQLREGGGEAREPLLPPAGGGQIFKDDMIGFPPPLIFSSWSGNIRTSYADEVSEKNVSSRQSHHCLGKKTKKTRKVAWFATTTKLKRRNWWFGKHHCRRTYSRKHLK